MLSIVFFCLVSLGCEIASPTLPLGELTLTIVLGPSALRLPPFVEVMVKNLVIQFASPLAPRIQLNVHVGKSTFLLCIITYFMWIHELGKEQIIA